MQGKENLYLGLQNMLNITKKLNATHISIANTGHFGDTADNTMVIIIHRRTQKFTRRV